MPDEKPAKGAGSKRTPAEKAPADKVSLESINFLDYTVADLQGFQTRLKDHLKTRSVQLALEFQQEVEELRVKKGLPASMVSVKVPKQRTPIYGIKGSEKVWDGRYPFYTPASILKADTAGTLIDPATGEPKKLAPEHRHLKGEGKKKAT